MYSMLNEKILVVDDVGLNREILSALLSDSYNIIEAADGEQAINILKNSHEDISIVLLDLIMPKVSGFEVINFMKTSGIINHVPVIVISVEQDIKTEQKCLELGVSDFIKKPFNKGVVKKRIKNLVDLFAYKNRLEEYIEIQTAGITRQNKILQEQSERLSRINEKVTELLGTIVESRHSSTGKHIWRVKEFTRIIAKKLAKKFPEYNLTDERIKTIADASPLHDIGKIAIKDSVLLKPGKLTPEEFEHIKTHTTKGYEILEQFSYVWDDEYRETAKAICRSHHERYDGKGYPDGLKGDEIPIEAQIVSVADVYDALTSKRVYKDAYALDKAHDMILNGECGVFSPKILECFKESKEEFEEIALKYREDDSQQN